MATNMVLHNTAFNPYQEIHHKKRAKVRKKSENDK